MQQAAAAQAATSRADTPPPVIVTAPAGGLALEPGKHVVARVVEIDTATGGARISLAGHTISVSTALPLAAGDTLSLTVGGTTGGRTTLSLDARGAASSPGAIAAAAAAGAAGEGGLALPGVSSQLSLAAPASVSSLAREGLPVTPQLAQAVTAAVTAIAGEDAGASVAQIAQSVASLASRGLSTDGAVAARVSAALELAGKLGGQLADLAALSPDVARALPGGLPTAAALRGLLTPDLTPAELAVARITQASVAAQTASAISPGAQAAAGTPVLASPTVLANYVASQVAHATGLPTSAAALGVTTAQAPVAVPGAQGPEAIAGAAQQADAEAAAGDQHDAGALAARLARPGDAELLATSDRASALAGRAGATGAAARGTTSAAAAATGTAGPATPQVAQVVADLSVLLGRMATTATAVPTDVARAAANQQANAAQGSFVPQADGGDVGVLVTTLREAMGDGGAGGGSASGSHGEQLAAALAGHSADQVAAALRQLPEQQALQLAGALLDQAGDAMPGLTPEQQAQVKSGIHAALDQLGRALSHGAHDEQAVLRAALHQVVAHDPRPEVQAQAQQLLDAADGAQLLSAPRMTADPGYVYFQVPMPGQRSAEVLVRREAGRRTVSFDHFDIAFLLETQSLGSLMIRLDAHPGAVNATITTDQPSMEPLLAAAADALRETVSREAKRPVFVNTGVFAGTPPTSLLQPALGLLPGDNSYYA